MPASELNYILVKLSYRRTGFYD